MLFQSTKMKIVVNKKVAVLLMKTEKCNVMQKVLSM